MTLIWIVVAFLAGVYAGEKFELYFRLRQAYGRARNWVKSRQ